MASTTSQQLHQWLTVVERNPKDTESHIHQLEIMFQEGWNQKEMESVVCELLRALYRARLPERRLPLEELLLWVCGQVSPSKELLRQFIYLSHHPHVHAFEELLKHYEGDVLPLDWFYFLNDPFYPYETAYVETLLGYDNVIDTNALRPIYVRKYLSS